MKLILLELNEINFDYVNKYLDAGENLEGFKTIINQGILNTYSEDEYINLEPWIQWPSVHSGKTFKEHGVFRLGDFVNKDIEQFFEKIESAGYSVGAISPMNASNRLKNPAYFIPDPWTQTSSDGTFFSKSITNAVSQAVNDNSKSKLTKITILNLCLAFIFLVNPFRFFKLARYAIGSFRKPWRKALFLDMFLHEIHNTLFKRKNPNFSTLFLNAGAHIQHHYFFNSPHVKSSELCNPDWYIDNNEDPFLEMLRVYDLILLDLIRIPDTEMIIATGLSQKPYDKLKFYYRLSDHSKFLNDIGISFSSVVPRMTRDFLINFNSLSEAESAQAILQTIMVDDKIRLFDEIDNRGSDLFVVLTFPDEINDNTKFFIDEESVKLINYVDFVAIKNGEHQSKGFLYSSSGLNDIMPKNDSHVSEIYNTIVNYFLK